MKRSQFSEQQILGTLKEAEAGTAVADLSRRLGLCEGTVYRWKAKYDGWMSVRQIGRAHV